MKRPWYGRDTELSVRMFVVMFLLAALYLGFMAVLWQAGADAVTVAVVAALLLGIQYFLSDKLVLWSMGARVVSPQEAPQLHGIVERLVALADLPMPQVAIAESAIPNAFATGRNPRNAVVCVTTGLLNQLNPDEIEAVLGHELSHIKNRDVLVITLASFFAMVAQFIMRSFMWGGMGSRGRGRDRGSAILLVYLASIVVWIASFFLIRALSRYRELAADRGAVILTGAPSVLASALVKISGTIQRIPERDLRQVEGLNAFFVVPALSGQSLMEIFSTHPSLDTRLARLKRLEQEMERRL